MNMKKTSRSIIAIFTLAFILCLLSIVAKAETYSANINYMAVMEAAAVTGDAENGISAENMRNAKIDDQGLTYQKVTWNDLCLLSKIIYAEAGSDWLSDEWKMSTGEVVLNRVDSTEFPNTIKEVIYQQDQYYDMNSQYFENLRPSMCCVDLARRLLEGERVLNDPSVVFQANFKQGSGTHTAMYDRLLGWTYFCYSSYPNLYREAET